MRVAPLNAHRPVRGQRLLDAKFQRPVATLYAAVAHGFCCNFFLSDETEKHGPNGFLDVLIHTLDEVRLICREKNIIFPDHLVVQSDNTTGQCKNNLTMLFLAYLVGSGKVASATITFLTVGHTHEDIDQIFGMVCEVLQRAGSWATLQELADILQGGLERIFRTRGERLNAWLHSGIRDTSGFAAAAMPE